MPLLWVTFVLGLALALTASVVSSRRKLVAAARTDALTRLPNRRALEEQLPVMLDAARKAQESVAVLFVDLDRFKNINDTMGHRAGDSLLRAVCNRFVERLSTPATVYRTGGDEFVVVVDRVRHKRTIAASAMDVLAVFNEPFAVDGRELFVSASVGASVFPKNADGADALMSYADSAMYRAKEHGGNNAKFYDSTMHARALERLALEQDLHHTVGRGEMDLVFQPVVELGGGRIVGAEALLRWNHPALGTLAPQGFISIAEETGAIVGISRWVLREACLRAANMRAYVDPDFRIAVNLSPRDFYEPDFAQRLAGILRQAHLPPSALDVEVTENIILNDAAVATLHQVHDLGVRIVMDDFGVAYSSLNYIKRLPVNALKIDKTFVDNVTSDPYDQGIVKAITTLGKTLGMRIIAEGVETDAQRHFLRSLECDYAQGYYFARPGRWEEIEQAVRLQAGPAARRVVPMRA